MVVAIHAAIRARSPIRFSSCAAPDSFQPQLYQFQQSPNPRSHGMPMTVRAKQLQRRRTQVQRHFPQSACVKIFLAWIGRHYREADALQRTRQCQLSAVNTIAATHSDLHDFACGVEKLPGLAL